MKLAVKNGCLYKTAEVHSYTQVVYNYLSRRCLQVFEKVRLVVHVEHVFTDNVSRMVQLGGSGLIDMH